VGNVGRVIDVTRAPFNAVGDGRTDDTAALVRAMDYVADRIRKTGQRESVKYEIYFPAGTYLVSDTVTYSRDVVVEGMTEKPDRLVYGLSRLAITGENRENTTIRLRDNSPGFEEGKTKPVVTDFREWEDHASNFAFGMQLRNLSIDTGVGNPGAVGLVFITSNGGGISNLDVLAPDGEGNIGLYLPKLNAQGYYHDITVQGFNIGIRAVEHRSHNPTFEHISLRGQREAGIWVDRSGPSFRDVFSVNTAPALVVAGKGAQVVLLDSTLTSPPGQQQPAIDLQEPESLLFVRNVQVDGYNAGVRNGTDVVVPGDIDEYNSLADTVAGIPQFSAESLGLPIKKSPAKPASPLKEWVSPEDFPSLSGSEAVQAALDSGKPTIYFPADEYNIGKVTVPPSVTRIEMMGADLTGTFQISTADQPLWASDGSGSWRLELLGNRTTIIRYSAMDFSNPAGAPAKVFLDSVTRSGNKEDFCPEGQKLWGRALNNETKTNPNFIVNGCQMWVMGYKTEGPQTSFDARPGSKLEVLGGFRNKTHDDFGLPQLKVDNADVSFIGYSSYLTDYPLAITETNGEYEPTTITRRQLPRRIAFKYDYYIPNFTSNAVQDHPWPDDGSYNCVPTPAGLACWAT
jgi:hypothetical protein